MGCLTWLPEGRPAVSLERRTLYGVSFLVLEAQGQERRIRRKVRSAAAEMRRRGVRRWAVPEGVPEEWRSLMGEVETHPLRQAMLPRLLDHVCASEHWDLANEAVLVSAPRADETVYRAAELLSGRCRYLLLHMDGAEGLYRALWRRFGVPAGTETSRHPCLQVSFGEPLEGIPTLLLGPGCDRRQRVIYELPPCPEPDGSLLCRSEEMAAALWSAGAFPASSLRLRSVEFHA